MDSKPMKQSKHKVIHGSYIANPKCCIWGNDVPHEVLDGDYTMIVCTDNNWKCLNEYEKQSREQFEKGFP